MCTVSGNLTVGGTPPLLSDHRSCPLPQYIILSAVIGYLAVAIFLRLPVIVKGLVLVAMAVVYILLILLSHAPIFQCYDHRVG